MGLCVAKHLMGKKGIDVVVFELGTKIGGLWVFDNDNGLSPAYQSLHVNPENKVTAYPDFPFPETVPLYPNHEQMAQYLLAYAEPRSNDASDPQGARNNNAALPGQTPLWP